MPLQWLWTDDLLQLEETPARSPHNLEVFFIYCDMKEMVSYFNGIPTTCTQFDFRLPVTIAEKYIMILTLPLRNSQFF